MADINYADQTYFEAYFTEILSNLKTWVDSEKTIALKKVLIKNNSLLFYKNPNATETDTSEYEIVLPSEKYLDLSLTTLVSVFSWSEETYPNSVNPNLNDKPVLVLAERAVAEAEDGTDIVTYSFISMESVLTKVLDEITALNDRCQLLEDRITALENAAQTTG